MLALSIVLFVFAADRIIARSISETQRKSKKTIQYLYLHDKKQNDDVAVPLQKRSKKVEKEVHKQKIDNNRLNKQE